MQLAERALAAGIVVLAGIAGQALCAQAIPNDPFLSSRGVALVGLGSACWIGSLALAVALLASRPATQMLALTPGRLPWGETAILVAGTLGVSQVIDVGIDWSGLRDASVLGELSNALAGARGGALAFALCGLSVAPGVAEELLFRGALQGTLLRIRSVPPLAAIALASLAFGAVHLDAVQSPATFVLGLYLGAVVWVTGGVRASIAAHVLNNAVAVVSSAFGVGLPGPEWAVASLSLLIAAPGLLLLARRIPAPAGAGHPSP